jgi:hypothetical protein
MMAQTACDMHRTLFPFFFFHLAGRIQAATIGKMKEPSCRIVTTIARGKFTFLSNQKGPKSSSMQMLIIGRRRRRRRGEGLCTCPLLLSFVVNKRIKE